MEKTHDNSMLLCDEKSFEYENTVPLVYSSFSPVLRQPDPETFYRLILRDFERRFRIQPHAPEPRPQS